MIEIQISISPCEFTTSANQFVYLPKKINDLVLNLSIIAYSKYWIKKKCVPSQHIMSKNLIT
jgi:hypothetical protein